MKKWILILGLSLFVWTGCTDRKEPEPEPEKKTEAPEEVRTTYMPEDQYWIEQGRDPNAMLEIKKKAWNWISEQDKTTVLHRWELAFVDKSVCRYESLEEKKMVEGECYSVGFSTPQDGLLGPIVVIVDLTGENVIGHQPRL